MKKFFLALFAQLTERVTEVKYIRMWNDQMSLVAEGKSQMFEHPAIFIEFTSSPIFQGGEGVQIYDPLIFKIHILHWQLDAFGGITVQDGGFDQNLDVFDLKDKVFLALQKFQPGLTDQTTPAGSCIRIEEYEDYKHAGVYHFVQVYKTTLVDKITQEPVDGIEWEPTPMPLEIDLYIPDGDTDNQPHVYNFTPEEE